MKFITPLTTLVALASASPITPAGPNPIDKLKCIIIGDISALLAKVNGGQANNFCSSYIASTATYTTTFSATTTATSTHTVPVTASTNTLVTAPTPEVTKVVYSNCGQPGYNLGHTADNFDGSGAYGTFDTCSARCLADTQCQSFAYGSGACLLFYVPVLGNLNPVATSPYTFFDRNCPASTVPTPNSKRDLDFAHAVPAYAPIAARGPPITPPAPAGMPAVQTPVVFQNIPPSKISSVCSCAITKASTFTVTSSTTTTSTSTSVVDSSTTVTTVTITSTITPAPTTVTVTTTY